MIPDRSANEAAARLRERRPLPPGARLRRGDLGGAPREHAFRRRGRARRGRIDGFSAAPAPWLRSASSGRRALSRLRCDRRRRQRLRSAASLKPNSYTASAPTTTNARERAVERPARSGLRAASRPRRGVRISTRSGLRHLAVDAAKQRLRIDAEQLRVVSQKAAHEHAAREAARNASGFQRFHLRRRDLQLARDVRHAETRASSRAAASIAPAVRRSSFVHVVLAHS